jgi:pilus assembly protein Flp/PilA
MTFADIKTSVMKFVEDEDGLTIVEYAVAGGLIAGATVLAFTTLGTAVGTEIGRLGTCISSKGATCP